MVKFISVDQFIHIHLPDGRTFQMEKWQARQVARELMVEFNIFAAFAPDTFAAFAPDTENGIIIDIFDKDPWLREWRENATSHQKMDCPEINQSRNRKNNDTE